MLNSACKNTTTTTAVTEKEKKERSVCLARAGQQLFIYAASSNGDVAVSKEEIVGIGSVWFGAVVKYSA